MRARSVALSAFPAASTPLPRRTSVYEWRHFSAEKYFSAISQTVRRITLEGRASGPTSPSVGVQAVLLKPSQVEELAESISRLLR
jgi:hypothetical protein